MTAAHKSQLQAPNTRKHHIRQTLLKQPPLTMTNRENILSNKRVYRFNIYFATQIAPLYITQFALKSKHPSKNIKSAVF